MTAEDHMHATLDAMDEHNIVLGVGSGALGRERVCALHKGEVEIPSDFSGVLWIRMDTGGAWQFGLAREIKAAGFEVDLNRLE
jgi:predicted nucleotide-binding protein